MMRRIRGLEMSNMEQKKFSVMKRRQVIALTNSYLF